MPKAEVGTPKWLSNRIKASGLQKLRWYCQMCQKQCRDENGFKCHRMSEGHQRAMQLFIQRPGKFMDEFSREFEHEFMKLMKTRYCRTRVLANSVYNNIVSDRHHIHMNATIWVTLSEFVQYLGATDKCRIEHTPKGWYVEYIDHEELARKKEEEKHRKVAASQEEAKMRRMEELIEAARKEGGFQNPVYTDLQREEGQLVTMALPKKEAVAKPTTENVFKNLKQQIRQQKEVSPQGEKRKLSALEALALEKKRQRQSHSNERSDEEDAAKAKESSTPVPPPHKNATDEWWICRGIVVKVMHKTLGGGVYYKQKAVIRSVEDRFTATVETLEGNAILKLDQDDLETVIPGIGGPVRIVKGKWRDHEGVLEAVNFDEFSVKILINKGPIFKTRRINSGISIDGFAYEDVCKMYNP